MKSRFKNLGFISKRKVAIAIAKQYVEHENEVKDATPDWRMRHWYAQSQLNHLCKVLKIKPMHRNELGGGTSEIIDD